MMSNCAFWSASGELLALHGADPAAADARAAFEPWASSLRLPAGRLVNLSPGFPVPEAQRPGWQTLPSAPRRKKAKVPRACDPSAPVATPSPALDSAASRLFPALYEHERFALRSWPTWVTSVRLEREEGPEGWYAALDAESRVNRFLVRLLPHRGRLPGEGWRNMLVWALKASGLRLVPINGLPRPEVLATAPAWEYRVEAGQGNNAAVWDVQVLPSRSLLLEWAPGTKEAWEATALLRWVRPSAVSPLHLPRPDRLQPLWADLFGRWSAADARLVVQNYLNTLPGGAAASAALFFDTLVVPAGADGKTLVRYVPQAGLPLALLSTLFGRRAWNEIERARRFLPPWTEVQELRTQALEELDRRVLEGRLLWSTEAERLWIQLYREPLRRAQADKLSDIRMSQRWANLLAGDPRVAEALLRALDVTDAALCLRDAPDARWRRFVTARREAELRAEMEFVLLWEGRGELTLERELEAWRAWDELINAVPLTDVLPEG